MANTLAYEDSTIKSFIVQGPGIHKTNYLRESLMVKSVCVSVGFGLSSLVLYLQVRPVPTQRKYLALPTDVRPG